MKGTKVILLGLIIGTFVLAANRYANSVGTGKFYHSPAEIQFFADAAMDLPLDSNAYFQASGQCDGCHGYDPTGHANTDSFGVDISPITRWRSSMMANAAKDPLWRAKVSHEVLVNPSHQAALEEKCTSCHAPMGHYSAIYDGNAPYSMADLATDSLGLDGVSCMVCHTQSEDQLGDLNSGNLVFDYDTNLIYGPYDKPFVTPMIDFRNLEPTFSEHIHDAGQCAGCHTLLTNSVDLNGNLTGETFVEQATYHEWLNSQYDDEGAMPITCQGCHIPTTDELIVISSNYLILTGLAPYGIHDLTGANVFMLQLMRDNMDQLGISSTIADYDTTISNTLRNLQQKSLDIELTNVGMDADSMYFEVDLLNKVGHKFPSGYPSRRAFIEFVVTDASNGDTLFKSGILQSDHELSGIDPIYEPHYDIIRSEDEVQVYEIVMGDINGDYTSTLERAYQPLKDNRMVPIGFSTMSEVYDTTAIIGSALTDDNFNHSAGVEGNGRDVIRYHVPTNGFSGTVNVTAKVYYQTLPPKFTQEMFSYSSAAIDSFEVMYNAADKSPIYCVGDTIQSLNVIIGEQALTNSTDWDIFPNPTKNGKVLFSRDLTGSEILVYSIDGELIRQVSSLFNRTLHLPEEPGVYLIEVRSDAGSQYKRVIRL